MIIEAVDLFCGAGGLTRGLLDAGIHVLCGYDIDEECRYAYEKNNGSRFINCDIVNLSGTDVESNFSGAGLRLLAGCAPCQPFSTYSRSARKEKIDSKWKLVGEFSRIISEVNPDLITMENVPQLAEHISFSLFLECLREYNVVWDVLDMSSLGIPQTRKRLVLIASKLGNLGLDLCRDNACSPVSVFDAIGHLPAIDAGQADSADRLHMASRLSSKNLERIRSSIPGGTWHDWPEHLRAECHRKNSGSTYSSVYGRMVWGEPGPTITTQCFGYGNGRFGHPEQDRAISLREASLLQTFPENYEFISPSDPVRFSVVGRMIGNAVPVKLGSFVGDVLVKHVNNYA